MKEEFDPKQCGLVDKVPDNPVCAYGCEYFDQCYPWTLEQSESEVVE